MKDTVTQVRSTQIPFIAHLQTAKAAQSIVQEVPFKITWPLRQDSKECIGTDRLTGLTASIWKITAEDHTLPHFQT